MHNFLNFWVSFVLLLAGCLNNSQATVAPKASNQTAIPSTLTFTTTTSATHAPTATVFPTSTPEPVGCLKPPDDYTRVEVNGWTINQRTFAMLAHAQKLYGGELEITGYAITQGSYHNNGVASFGTHLGGGAVDLSVLRRGTYTVLWDDIEPLLHALRVAGFAALFREIGVEIFITPHPSSFIPPPGHEVVT